MRSIEIYTNSFGSYSCKTRRDYSNYGMEILADWFICDVTVNSQGWIEWMNDDSEAAEATESNATWLEKDQDTIIFGSITDMIQSGRIFEPRDDQMISIPKDQVIDMLKSWDLLRKTRPEKIMITEENGVFKMFEVQ